MLTYCLKWKKDTENVIKIQKFKSDKKKKW